MGCPGTGKHAEAVGGVMGKIQEGVVISLTNKADSEYISKNRYYIVMCSYVTCGTCVLYDPLMSDYGCMESARNSSRMN